VDALTTCGDGVVDRFEQCDDGAANGAIACCTSTPTIAQDLDGVCDASDNCPSTYNPTQGDLDGDGVEDACDPDVDGDGIDNVVDNCVVVANPDQTDPDLDGFGDACDNCPGSSTSTAMASATPAIRSRGRSTSATCGSDRRDQARGSWGSGARESRSPRCRARSRS
jgi:Thrombospondin type 3 repeat